MNYSKGQAVKIMEKYKNFTSQSLDWNKIQETKETIIEKLNKEKNEREEFYDNASPHLSRIKRIYDKYESLQDLGIEHIYE